MQPRVSDFLEAGAPSRSRSTSLSSDSQLPRVNLMSPPSVTPPPGFISSTAASEIITADQEFNAADFVAEDEETGGGASALVTPAALSLLNGFLDNLLFNILGASKSTQLTCIRPAVADVLKPRLAREVVSAADEELSEYMGGAEDEQTDFRGGQEPGGDFDLVRSWKLTRLRCMVYTRLGDMEEDDEDEFIALEGLGESDGAPRRFSSHVDNITPAAAIFLTSIIEYIGERALVIAGETARSRLSATLNDGDGLEELEEQRRRIERLVVEDLDMEKLALNATLGRLWRTWRKRRRGATLSRSLSRESFRRRGFSHNRASSRKSSITTIEEPVTPQEPLPIEVPAPIDPTTVPLPMTDYDVQEIEIPGFSSELEGEVQTMEAIVAHKVRPRSLMVFSSPSIAPKSTGSNNSSPVSASVVDEAVSIRHVRSRSLPNSACSPTEVAPTEPSLEQPSPTAEEKKQLETMYEDDESAEYVDAAETAPGIAITTAHEELNPPVAETPEKARMSVVHEVEEEAGPAVNEAVASLRSAELEKDAATYYSSSATVSISSMSDVPDHDPEVIEGQGMCEKPTLTSALQRPRRTVSRDIVQEDAKPITAETSESEMQSDVEMQPPTQGMEPTPAPSAATIEAINSSEDHDAIDSDRNTSAMSSTPPIPPTNDEAISGTLSEPVFLPEPPDRILLQAIVSTRNDPELAADRVPVQRMPTRPSTSACSSIQSKPRRSESFSSARDKRPVTAGSTTSQVSNKLKGLMGRPQGDSPSLRLRSSSETSRASGGSGDSLENEIRDLDKLINSDETIHYTLTPKSVREMTFPDLPRPIPRTETTDTSDLADFLKNTGPVDEPPRPRTSISSRATGDLGLISRTKSTESSRHIPLTPRASMPKLKAGQARDARPTGESTREFAEFIKATGPTSAPFQLKNSTSTETARPVRPPSSLSTTSSRLNRARLQARPAETKGSETSDLIDFIREGPSQPGTHRIPRTVAPFRNTIDSDDLQFELAQSDKGPTAGSSLASSGPNKSLTSLGSRTALLNGQSKANGLASAQDGSELTRKQRRVRDPYAIDDDDDELLAELMDEKPKREEESLMDFLRSAPPPDFEQTAKPLAVNIPPSTSSSGPLSPAGMKARFLHKGPTSKVSFSSLRSQTSPANTSQPPPPPPQSNYSYKVGVERNAGTMPVSFNRQTETSALADFLRNTGPPEPVSRASTSSGPMSSRMKEGSLSRFFVRRKKVEA
ncbi:hypothetical protein NUU61_008089 [Penicillium alfredii]|uniref:Flo11 n=1 Tax=Penicillium alfredii TaxID=1506179 RepID=A0A9W9ERQ2_9EURO|nr:uncharacterized protein NUU61_008089 [Penicillium alfredii]KAJ5086782.1 hypothetical protein NUU61_008089 [Penicillium alfredii]